MYEIARIRPSSCKMECLPGLPEISGTKGYINSQFDTRAGCTAFPLSTAPITISAEQKGAKLVKEVKLMHIYKPDNEVIRAMKDVWDKSWISKTSIDPSCRGEVEEILRVTEEQIKEMSAHSWRNIIIAEIDGQIIGGIWGITQDQNISERRGLLEVSGYNWITANRTFQNADQRGNTRFCVSVVVSKYHSFKDQFSRSIGQILVINSLIDAIIHPYQTDVIAYSRPSSLHNFLQLLAFIEKKTGEKIRFDFKNKEQAASASISIDSEGKGITVKGVEYRTKDISNESDLYEVKTDGYYYLGQKLVIPENEEKIYLGNECLVDLHGYLDTEFDQMKRFHGGLGGEIRGIYPNSRVSRSNPAVGDPDSLGFNVIYRYPTGRVLEKLTHAKNSDILRKILRRMSPKQRRIVTDLIRGEEIFKSDDKEDIKKLFRGAFSYEKMAHLIKFIESNRGMLIR